MLTVHIPLCHMPINAYNLYPLLSYAHQCLLFVSLSLSYAHQCLPFISPSVICQPMLTIHIPFCHMPINTYHSYPLLSYAHQCLLFVSLSLSYAHQCLLFISPSVICQHNLLCQEPPLKRWSILQTIHSIFNAQILQHTS